MSLQTFVDRGGFKLLAVGRLAGGSYALVCYLVNCLAAGVEEVVSSAGELAVLLGVPERQVRSALEELETCNIVLLSRRGAKTFAARLNLDPATWQNLRREGGGGPNGKRKRTPLGDARNVRTLMPQMRPPSGGEQGLRDVTNEGLEVGSGVVDAAPASDASARGEGLSPGEALVFPSGQRSVRKANKEQDGTLPARQAPLEANAVTIVLQAFAAQKEGRIDEEKEHAYAALLCENHPVGQIVDLLAAFGREIPSLGLLAGAWMHYTERYHRLGKEEISLEAYRKKNEAIERKLRHMAAAELKRAQLLKVTLSADEELLLRIFMRHDHPRSQLYWALQARERYPHLQDFFGATSDMAHRGKGAR